MDGSLDDHVPIGIFVGRRSPYRMMLVGRRFFFRSPGVLLRQGHYTLFRMLAEFRRHCKFHEHARFTIVRRSREIPEWPAGASRL
jgi:hypothetical protein